MALQADNDMLAAASGVAVAGAVSKDSSKAEVEKLRNENVALKLKVFACFACVLAFFLLFYLFLDVKGSRKMSLYFVFSLSRVHLYFLVAFHF